MSFPSYPDLAGKVALVSGSSRGIGFATAKALAHNGATVILNGRDAARLEAARAQLADLGDVHTVQADFSVDAQIRDAIEGVRRDLGQLDILVANAGGDGVPQPLADIDGDRWRHVVDLNLTSAFVAMQAAIPVMVDNGGGSIVTVSSTAGRQPSKASPAYGAAKAGLVMLTRQFAMDFAPKGIRVNCVAPGAVLTEDSQLANAPADVRAGVAAQHPLGRLGTPDDIANAILFLASDAASWITGITIDVSGGRVTG